MSSMLASVNSLAEAQLVERYKVDIIDLKEPAGGALGALPTAAVKQIVSGLQPSTLISATIGDLPMQPELVTVAVAAMAATGVDYVKIGFFPGGDWLGCIQGLTSLTRHSHDLIAVLFADTQPDFAVISQLAAAGFRGVMLDTMDKQRGALTQIMTNDELRNFVRLTKKFGLLCGLAGSLKMVDIAGLLPLQADYLGFRGGLCRQGCRTAALDEQQILQIRQLLAINNVPTGIE